MRASFILLITAVATLNVIGCESGPVHPKARRVKEICIGSVVGAKDTKVSGKHKDGEKLPDEYEYLPAMEATHDMDWRKLQASEIADKEWYDLPSGAMNNCLQRGFQPTGEWVVLPGAKSHYNNSHYPPSAFMMFVKYEDEPPKPATTEPVP